MKFTFIVYAAFLFYSGLSAQTDSTRVITGYLYINKQPMPGASVSEKGTINAAMTDINGHFELEIPVADEIELSFSFLSEPVCVIVKHSECKLNVFINHKTSFHLFRILLRRGKRIIDYQTEACNEE